MSEEKTMTDKEKIVIGIDALIISTVRDYLIAAGHKMEDSKIRGMCINSLRLVELRSSLINHGGSE